MSEQWRVFADAVPHFVWSAQPDGAIDYGNRRLLEYLGRTEEGILGWTWVCVLHPDDVDRSVAAWGQAVSAGSEYFIEYRIRRASDGEYRWHEGRASPLRDDGGRIERWLGTCTDIHDRKQAEEELREREQMLNRAQEIAHLGSWELDLLTNRLAWSDEVYRIFGLEPQEFAATYEAFLEAVHPDDRAAVDDAYSSSLKENRDSYEIEHRVIRRSTGEVRLVHEKCEHFRDASGQIFRSVGMVHDITEREVLAESLRHRESTLAQAGKMAQLGAWEIEISTDQDLDRNRLRWSDEVYRIFGYAPGQVEVTNELFFDRVHPEDRPRIHEAVATAIALRQPYSIEHRIIRPDGAERIVFEHAEITFDEQGRPVHILGAVQDVTERKRAEDALRSALEAADAASRAKSDFLARMSHELRTPMNGIMGMTELSLMEPELPERAREFLQLAKQSSKGLLEIINDVLDIARIEAGRAELVERPFDLAASVGDLLAPLRHTAEGKGLRLRYRPSADLPTKVLGDEGRLRQVLTNLVANAVKFTEGGEVDVAIRASEEPASPGRRRFLFAVRDTGIGIPPENLSAVFDSFSGATRSTHAKYGGTGLGLSIARQLTELMGGRIWVESPAPAPSGRSRDFPPPGGHELGPGSAFYFTVELALPEGASAAVREQSLTFATGGRLRVLLAEDNPLNQIFTRELLGRLGHDVVVAADGAEALSALSRETFDLVLMDVEMPVLSGEEVTKRIRAGLAGRSPGVPVIALTAHALDGDRERFLASGMDDYISKPFDLERIKTVICGVLEGRRGDRRVPEEPL